MAEIKYNSNLTRIIRKELGDISREKLAKMVAVDLYVLQRWEDGISQPRVDQLATLHDIACQNGMISLPFYLRNGAVQTIPINNYYLGEHTLPKK
tara:strand:- start:965 stop:1249 length:285 start_codon:yes stop_codon:yes gene_type:complete